MYQLWKRRIRRRAGYEEEQIGKYRFFPSFVARGKMWVTLSLSLSLRIERAAVAGGEIRSRNLRGNGSQWLSSTRVGK